MLISRRSACGAIGALLLGGGATAAAVSRLAYAEGLQPHPPDDLPNPPEVVSRGGLLSVELDVRYATVTLPEGPAWLRSYGGSLPAPTWRFRPGDRIEVLLRNSLPSNAPAAVAERAGVPADALCLVRPDTGTDCFNITNLHFHGMHVDPRKPGDDVFLEIRPDESFRYVVDVPHDHPQGTFWYHPHHHGSVALQVASGMAGMIVVDSGTPAPVLERQLVVQAPVAGPDGMLEDGALVMSLEDETRFLVNGRHRPRIHLREGETQLWRVLFANASQVLPLDFAALDGIAVRLVAFDGNPLAQPEELNSLVMAPGNRADLLVTGTKPGEYALDRAAFAQGLMRLAAKPLATVVVLPGDRSAARFELAASPPRTPVRDEEIVHRRRFELHNVRTGDEPTDVAFLVNGRAYDPDDFAVVARLGSAEEWTFVNMTPFPHPMHIHVNPFEVVEIDGVAQDRRWMDTVLVPAAGVVRIRTRFEDFPGDFVMHCHILPHEDAGMMLNVRVTA